MELQTRTSEAKKYVGHAKSGFEREKSESNGTIFIDEEIEHRFPKVRFRKRR